MSKELISIRLDSGLLRRLRDKATASSRDLTAVIEAGLRESFKTDTSARTVRERFSDIEDFLIEGLISKVQHESQREDSDFFKSMTFTEMQQVFKTLSSVNQEESARQKRLVVLKESLAMLEKVESLDAVLASTKLEIRRIDDRCSKTDLLVETMRDNPVWDPLITVILELFERMADDYERFIEHRDALNLSVSAYKQIVSDMFQKALRGRVGNSIVRKYHYKNPEHMKERKELYEQLNGTGAAQDKNASEPEGEVGGDHQDADEGAEQGEVVSLQGI